MASCDPVKKSSSIDLSAANLANGLVDLGAGKLANAVVSDITNDPNAGKTAERAVLLSAACFPGAAKAIAVGAATEAVAAGTAIATVAKAAVIVAAPAVAAGVIVAGAAAAVVGFLGWVFGDD